MQARRSLGRPAFHVFPQVLKTDIEFARGAGYHFIGFENSTDAGARTRCHLMRCVAMLRCATGSAENLQADLATLLGPAHLRIPNARSEMIRQALLNTGTLNDGSHNRDRCNNIVQPAAAEIAARRGDLCEMLAADYACFSRFYGTCDAAVDAAIRKYGSGLGYLAYDGLLARPPRLNAAAGRRGRNSSTERGRREWWDWSHFGRR